MGLGLQDKENIIFSFLLNFDKFFIVYFVIR